MMEKAVCTQLSASFLPGHPIETALGVWRGLGRRMGREWEGFKDSRLRQSASDSVKG